MADTKISALPASTTPLAGTETLPIVQSSTTKKVSVANLTAGRQVEMSSYNMGITAFTPTAAGTISDGTDNSATEKITELLVVADDNTWKTSGASFATYRTWLNTTGIRMRVSNGAARYSSWDFTPAGNIQQLVAGEGVNFTANTPAAGMTSRLLNWYEEGTWTPIDDSGAGLTLANASGYYTRVGRQVTVTARLDYPATANGLDARVGGLPFTILNQDGAWASGVIGAAGTGNVKGLLAPGGTTYVALNGGPGAGTITNANMTGASLRFSLTYFV